jgi:penicillin amidase
MVRDDPGDNIAASYRQIIDLGDLDQAMAIHAPGQSGQIGSPFYSNMIESWFGDGSIIMTWDTKSVKKATEESLTLYPAQ